MKGNGPFEARTSILPVLLLLNLVAGCAPARLQLPGARVLYRAESGGLRDPSWSPDGSQIALINQYSPDDYGQVQVVSVDDGRLVSTFAANTYYLVEPNWGAGSLVYGVGCNELHFVELSSERVTARLPGCGAHWSLPDQRLVVFSQGRTVAPHSFTVRVVDQAGLVETDIYAESAKPNEDVLFGGIEWSGSTEAVAFSFFSGNLRTLGTLTNRDIYATSGPAEPARALVATPADEYDPSWSPDGNWLVFIAFPRSPDPVPAVMFARFDGSCVLTGFSGELITGVDWSPDGDQLALTVGNALYLVDLAEALGEDFFESRPTCEAPDDLD